jgi:aminopeptidase N
MKKTLALASVVLMAGALTACGGDDNSSSSGGGSYCDQVKEVKSTIDNFDFTKLDEQQFSAFQSSLNSVEDAAPDSVKQDWATLNDAVDQLKGILADAGLTFDDLQAIQEDPSNLPEGVDIAKLQALAQKLNEFTTNTDIQDATDAISANVQDECGIDLSDTSSTTGS